MSSRLAPGRPGRVLRVSASYATNPHGLPKTFVIKLPARDNTVHDRVTIGYRSECTFYATVADRVRVPTPQCFYCDILDDGAEYALLLADQAPAVQGDQIAGCGEQEARLAVTALAGLHGHQLVRSGLAGLSPTSPFSAWTRRRPRGSATSRG